MFIFKNISGEKSFLAGSATKNSPANAENVGWIPGSGISPGEGHGNSLQYSCLRKPMDREAWWVAVHGAAKCWT